VRLAALNLEGDPRGGSGVISGRNRWFRESQVSLKFTGFSLFTLMSLFLRKLDRIKA